MGKVTRNSTDQEEKPKPRRKRRKADLNRLHSKILRAKQKLDNVGKNDNKATGRKRQGRAKICNRLLPEPAAGIYRNGAKGQDIQRGKITENTYHNARLKADALKLFNGDTRESKCTVEIPIHDGTTEQSLSKDCMKNLCFPEQSPVLGKKKNQKLCLVKKKSEENIFEDADFHKIKRHVNDESRHVQKEAIHKRRLFQNDGEQLETTVTIPTQTFDNIDVTKENKANERGAEQSCSKNSKDSFSDPLSRYMEFCKISAKKFEVDILPNQPDPEATTINRLKNIHCDSYRQQLLRKKKRELENVESSYSEEHQACTNSDVSQLSPVEFEVPKCSKDHITARLQEGVPQKDKFHLIHKAKLRKSNDTTRYNFEPCSPRDTFAACDANGPIMKNVENSDTQYPKQPKDTCQLSKLKYFCPVNKKDFIQLDSQENTNVNLLKSKRYDKDNFSIDIPLNSRGINNSKDLRTSRLFSDPVLSERYLKDYSCDKLSVAFSDSAPNMSQKCNNRTYKWDLKNIKRVPTILHHQIAISKPSHSVQINGDYAEDLYKKCEINLFNTSPGNDIEQELYETAFPNNVRNLPTSGSMNATFNQAILEPQIGSMKIKDSQESQVEQFNINMHPKEHNRRNGFYRHDGSLYPQTFEVSYNTNTEKLPQQEQISVDMRKHNFNLNNYRPINYLQSVNSSNFNAEPAKQFPHQTKLYIRETNKQKLFRKNTRDQNQNILFNNDQVNDRAKPTPIFTEVNVPQNIQTEKRPTESCRENLGLFDKTDVKCAKNRINQNAYHCNEQYIYFDPANCPRKYKEQVHYFHKEIAQPESLCDTRGYNNSTDKCVNLSSTTRNAPLLSLKQKSNLYTYPKAINDQYRAVLLQNVTQPVKYLAVESGSDIQRIPVYISNDGSVRVVENVPLKVIIDPSTQTKTFPQGIAAQVVPLQTAPGLHLNDFVTRKISDQSFVKRSDSVNAILLNPDSQSNIWYASNL